MKKNLITCAAILAVALLFGVSLSAVVFAEGNTDAWGYTDEDGDGMILVSVPGETYTGRMLIVLDPTRVVLGCRPDRIYEKGYTVAEFAEQFGAVAGVNGGGFEDYDGMGNGSVPDSTIVSGGEVICGWIGAGNGFAGIDADGRLHVGLGSVGEITELGIQEGAGYGPVLLKDGKPCNVEESAFHYWIDTLNPRTAIGQRQDGAILLLVIDGREPNSLGGSFADETAIMQNFGAVNACSLDGGNSSLMWYKGRYLNNEPGTFDIRPIPTSFLVLKEGKGTWQGRTVSESERSGLTREEREALVPTAEQYPDNCSETEKRELRTLAELYTERYVTFSADVDGWSVPNYSSLIQLVVPDGALQQRLHGAFGSFGYWRVSSCGMISCKTELFSKLPDGKYLVTVSYDTSTTAGKKMPVIAQKQLALTVVERNGQYLVEAMRFF